MTHGVCDSCGREEDDLETVHRAYVVPESWDTPGSVSVEDGVERWCFPCRTHYPHQPTEGVGPTDGTEGVGPTDGTEGVGPTDGTEGAQPDDGTAGAQPD